MQCCVVAALFTYTVCENKFKYKLGKKKKKLLIKIMWLKSSRTACSKATVVKSELCVSDVFTIIIPILIIMSHRHSLSNTINVILSSNVNWLQRNEPQKALISAT